MKYKNTKNGIKGIIKLTNEEIYSVNGFANLSDEEAEAIADFIYNISIILYKTNNDGKS
jgi:hypothetical protein